MSHVFISYSTKDQEYADKLAQKLREEGFNVWIAPSKLRASQTWWEEILKALRVASAVVVIMSPESRASEWVQREIFLADQWRKAVFPLLLKGENFELYVTTNYEDVREGKLPSQDFYAQLGEVVERNASAVVDAEPVKLTRKEDISAVRKAMQDVLSSSAPSMPWRNVLISFAAMLVLLVIGFSVTPTQNEVSPADASLTAVFAQRTATQNALNVTATARAEATASLLASTQTRMAQEAQATQTQEAQNALATQVQATVNAVDRREALARARGFVGKSNRDWTPFEHTFEDGVTMVLVPAGCFMMGSESWYAKPTQRVCFKEPFWLDKTEVTQADFARLGGVKANANRFSGDSLPVETITWFEARDFCVQRGGRLPTEAEWEYAARGVEAWAYPWGNEFTADNVVHRENSGNRTAPAGSRPDGASWVGAMDMAGNAREWVLTLYRSYPYPVNADGTPNDGAWVAEGNSTDRRVLRGGSWVGDTNTVRSAYRGSNNPNIRDSSYGFRCVRANVGL
jgi:formylglycine-generating enzyme required for sulfatase activity